MKILNYGSLNIDHVYTVPHIVRPGETLASETYEIFGGGKGANQSLAVGRAGGEIYHAGKIGPEGRWLLDLLTESGVHVEFVCVSDIRTGHAVIQVDARGENAIFLFPGSNKAIAREEIDETFAHFGAGDMLLLQNEINEIPYILGKARANGMRICLNPAPFSEAVAQFPLDAVSILVANEIEARGLTQQAGTPPEMLAQLAQRLPNAEIVLTLGAEGVLYGFRGETLRVPARKVKTVDTTAAGDTFVGYFLAACAAGRPVRACLETACRAAAVCVSRKGAMASIPYRADVEAAP
ncbi:MAG: ribokinase [Kiritimatiellae bacterium]|nr:ribokinase [Kiritimatiellia bacterium]